MAIPALLADFLRAYRKETKAGPDDLVFGDEHGSFLRHSNFRNRVWIPAVAKGGLPEGLRIHDYADLRVMPTSRRSAWSAGVWDLKASA